MVRRLAVTILFLVLCGGSAPRATADEPLVVAYIADSVDSVAGRAVMKEAYRRLEIPVEFRPHQAKEALASSNSGKVGAELQRIDGIHHRFTNLVQVPIPINYVQGLAFSKRLEFPIQGWHSLKPYRIGIVKGILFAERGTEGMEVAVADTYPELIRWITEEKVDVGVMPRISGLVALHESGNKEVRMMAGVLETLLTYHYLHRSRANLEKRLSGVLKEMLLDGTTQRLRRQANDKLLGRDP